MSEVTITREDGASQGAYLARVEGHSETGELTYRKAERGKVLVADHTFVPPELRGQSVAGKLVDALIADARADGTKIRPVCSYVVAAFKRHPEWSDVLA